MNDDNKVVIFKGGTDHAGLTNLDYANSGHTGFASSAEVNNCIKTDDTITNTEIEEILNK